MTVLLDIDRKEVPTNAEEDLAKRNEKCDPKASSDPV